MKSTPQEMEEEEEEEGKRSESREWAQSHRCT